MARIILEGHIVVPDVDLAAVLLELPNHIRLTLEEAGCLRFEVTQKPDNKNVFCVSEEFVDRAAFEAHQRRVQSSEWGRVTSSVERHYQVTERAGFFNGVKS